jgi:acyl-CoA synthetase (AMP-forming)/AMP-acid ligase II
MRTLIGEALRRHAGAPNAPAALVSAIGAISYVELVARVERCAAWLLREGCQAPVPIGVSVVDETDSLVVSLALLDLGVPQVTLSTGLPGPMRIALARRLALGRVVVDHPRHALPDVATSVLVPDELRDPERVAPVALACDPDAAAVFVTSSGTTGIPKILGLSQRVIARRALQLADAQAFAPDERVLVPMSNQEYPGKSVRVYMLVLGATAVHWPGGPSTPTSVPAYCAATKATTLHLTVLQARALVNDADGRDRLPASTRVFLGASRMPAGLPAAFEERIGGRLYNRYGTTEVGIVASMFPDGDDGTPDSVGRPLRGAEIEIVDPTGRPLPPGEPGEIRVRCGCMIDRYHDDPVATSRHFADGWFYPRDVGLITPGGMLRFLGRSDDMMMLNGINIFPAEIERVLEEHPAVRNAAAFPIASATYGDIPAAAVELNGTMEVDVPALSAYARERLGVRAPRKVVIVAALPRNANGKVVKRELAAALAQGRTGG